MASIRRGKIRASWIACWWWSKATWTSSALAQHGISYATATLGTATSNAHLDRVYRLCPEVVFCFDGDEAGRKAAFRALEAALPCMEDGRQAKFLFLPEGQDPDDAVRGGGQAHFEALLATAVPLETFLFDAVAQGLDLSNLDGRARMSKLALPYVRQLPEGVYRQLMFQALAQRTGLELSSLMLLEAPSPSPTEELPDYGPESDYEPPADHSEIGGPDHGQPEPQQPAPLHTPGTCQGLLQPSAGRHCPRVAPAGYRPTG